MKLNYKSLGSGDPIIILHGLFGMLDNWQTAARMMMNRYQCILVDLRNHGRSPHDDNMNYKVMAEDIGELMDDMHLKEAFLLGHSMGGKVAMQFAISNPVKVKKLVVVDISPGEYRPHHDHVLEAIASIDPSNIEERSDAEASFRRHIEDDEATIQFLLKNLSREKEGGFKWKANMKVLHENYSSLMEAVDPLQTYNKPTLFIRGENSNSVKDQDWESIIDLFPYARLITIAGAGHWVHADAPGALTEAVLTFLESD